MTQRSHDGWAPCPRGEFQRLSGRLRQRRRRRLFLRGAGATAAAAITGGAVGLWLRLQGGAPPRPANLTCAEVRAWAGDYLRGTLDAERREQVRQHLSGCIGCADWFQLPA